MLKRDVGAQWPALELPPVAPLVLTHQLESQALIYEPKLAEMRQVVKQSEASVELARRQRLPDVSMGLEARNYSGNGSFRQGTLLLGMSLPWVNKSRYQSDVAREDAKLEAARLDTTEYEFSIREELHRLSTAVDVARRQALLYRDGIIPRTTATLATIQASWSTGRATLTEVLEARRLLLEGQIAYAQAITDQYSALADLVRVCDLSGIDKLLELTTAPSPAKPPGS
jgi:outer membrane protein TolC